MRCFLLYVDDWLASQHIRQMDAHEELAYFHLILCAATEEDCWLPDNDPQFDLPISFVSAGVQHNVVGRAAD